MVDMMVFYMNSVANGTHQIYTPPTFEASSTDITINCLFFASLSASLVAALASVVSLQWVADYDAAITRGGSSPEDRAKRRQFRYAGVVSWKMGEIIAALPILLYFSVILFLAGLILWMTVTNQIVGAIFTGGASVAVLFYGVSTLISVFYVSAPFRTPLSLWVYSLYHLPLSAVYRLTKTRTALNIPPWLKSHHLMYKNARKRVDLAVENRGELGKDALVWLANQLSISQDSYRQLILLVSELPSLDPKHMPSFKAKEAPWYNIFDLLGWKFLAAKHVSTVNGEEKQRMEILQRCHAIGAVQEMTDPPAHSNAHDLQGTDYWDQFCDVAGGGHWNDKSTLPNHLYLLLRDTPRPFGFSPQEMGVIISLGRWRNSTAKSPQVWDEVFSLEPSFHDSFFSSCVVTFSNFVRSQDWRRWDKDNRRRYISAAGEFIHIAIRREDISPPVILLLIQAFEAILTGFGNTSTNGAACLSRPLRYGRNIQQSNPDDHLVHDSIILLLSRNLRSYSTEERALRVREVIAMLWLRPSNPVPRRWETIQKRHGPVDQWDPVIIVNWLQSAELHPHIMEILRHLVNAQAGDPSVGSLWRTTATNGVNDPHFVEALQMFDRLMTDECSASDHCMMVRLVCQELESEDSPSFEDYFTLQRLNAIHQLHDPCLRLLANCARGSKFLDSVVLAEDYHTRRKDSLDLIEGYLLTSYPEGDSSETLELKAALWPTFSGQGNLYSKALERPSLFVSLICKGALKQLTDS
jgi:hypothetical protein